ncbi:sporulation protein [Streptomyces sp. NPDC101115]|uniref:sporulation protein n=1 Tax=Streptomyces sp. NPDC101115 TaxID=3366106 RepID=UPI00382EEB83
MPGRHLGHQRARVDTVPGRTAVHPGEELPFRVAVHGGGADVRVDRLTVELVIVRRSQHQGSARRGVASEEGQRSSQGGGGPCPRSLESVTSP